MLNKHRLNEWASNKGQRRKGEATDSARFDREGGPSLLRTPAPVTSRMLFMGVTVCAPRARPQTGQCTSTCLSHWIHTQSPSTSAHKHILGTLLPGPGRAGGCSEAKRGTKQLQYSRTTSIRRTVTDPHPARQGGKAAWKKVQSERCRENGQVTRDRAEGEHRQNPRSDSPFQELRVRVREDTGRKKLTEDSQREPGSGHAREPCCRNWTSSWGKPGALEESWAGQPANGQRRLGNVQKAGLGYGLLRQGRVLGWGAD